MHTTGYCLLGELIVKTQMKKKGQIQFPAVIFLCFNEDTHIQIIRLDYTFFIPQRGSLPVTAAGE